MKPKSKLISIFFVLFYNSLSCFSQDTTINFYWGSDSLNGVYFEKTAMHIPIHFENDTNTYYLQVDTGSDRTFLYSFDSLNSNSPLHLLTQNELQSDIGLLKTVKLDSENCYWENGRFHIGTLGADFFENKIIEVDFPRQQLRLLQNYDSTNFRLKTMKLSYGRPVLQIEIQNKIYDFMFDTGSSLFDLWTTKALWNKFKDKSANVEEFPISSWGIVNKAYRTLTDDDLNLLLCSQLKISYVWYNSNKNFAKDFKAVKIDGIIGNKPFLNQVLLIDFKNKKIGVKQCI